MYRITPAKNEQAFITKALDSVVAQTLLPRAGLLLTTVRRTARLQIVESYAKRYPWIELVRRQQHSGSQLRQQGPRLQRRT